MKKTGILGLLVIFALVFSNGYLYAQTAPTGSDIGEFQEEAESDTIEVNDAPIIPGDDELASLLNERPNAQAVVNPLTKAKWNQRTPYNNLFPFASSDIRELTLCETTARAIIMAYHRYPSRGPARQGQYNGVPVNFNIAYDWANILNSYRGDDRDSTDQQRNAIAALMLHVRAAKFSGVSGNSRTGIFLFFGYDKSIQSHDRVFYTDADWEALIRSQLAAGLPVYYRSDRTGGAHAFVVDGYDSANRFHVNWGWGGLHDGWYSLNNLAPSSGRNYDRGHLVITNIKPDQGSTGSHEMGLNSFTAATTTATQNELFTVTANIRSLGVFPGGQVGVALTNTTTGTIAAVVGTANYGERNPASSLTRTMNCYVPETVQPGNYQLRIVTRYTNGEWKTVTRSAIGNGIPSSYNFTLKAETVTPGGGHGLALTLFTTTKTAVTQNELFTTSYSFMNIAQDTFPGGTLAPALVDNRGDIKAIIGSTNFGARASNSKSGVGNANSFVPSTVAPGQYTLRIAVKPANSGQWRIATMSLDGIPNAIPITVTAGEANGDGYGLALLGLTASKTTVPRNEQFDVGYRFRNVGTQAFSGEAGVALVDNSNTIVAVLKSRNTGNFGLGSTNTNPISVSCAVPSAVAAGNYRLRMVVRPEGGEWRIATISVDNSPTSINFTVTAAEVSGYGLVLEDFTVDKTAVSQYQLFTVQATIRNQRADAFSGGQIGAALVNNNGTIVEVIGTTTIGAFNSGQRYSNRTMNCFIPDTVRAGPYQLRIVIRPTGGEWRVATMSIDGIPNAINITVSAGEANGGGYGMGLTSFTASKTTVSQNEQFDVNYQLKNVGTDAFNGQTGAALVDNNNNIVAVLRSWNTGNFVVGARNSNPINITCTLPNTVAPGRYRLRMVVRPTDGEWRVATISVDNSPTSIDFTVR